MIKFVFLYLRIYAEFSKRLCKVSLNKGMLKCKTFIQTLSKLTRRCRRVLLWSHATQTYLSTKTLIRSSGCLLFTVITRTSLLVQADISFSLSWSVQTKTSIWTFSYRRYNPHKITGPYTNRGLLSSVVAYIGQLVQKGHLLLNDISHSGLPAHTDVL